ncbi:hypothetical protein [Auraticoccus monumenti]|uniref:hypothetical protein n=1 Tax=Auraticoccus monumenti TaxID=675864 RepID=UPI000B804DFB|nr:hypothetical protein [Auraticoccus monumenti]
MKVAILTLLVTAVGVLLTVPAGMAGWLAVLGGSTDREAATHASPRTTEQPIPSPRPSPTADAPTHGKRSCFDVALVEVSCNLPHRAESVPDLDCDRATVFGFLGGVAGVDALAFTTAAQGGDCLVTAFDDVTGDFAGSARARSSAPWRQCFDGDIAVIGDRSRMACDEAHTIEWISSPDSAEANSASCEAAAHAYLSSPLGSHPDVRVRPLVGVEVGLGQARCELYVQSGSRLSGTLRNLENGQLPRER